MSDLSNLAKREYVDRVNRAIDFITARLAGSLRLEEVADAACFSPFHFHRIFRAATGETLADFVKRVRLERAVYLLSHRQGATLLDIALACGFSSSSDFSRSFRKKFGVAPRYFDVQAFRAKQREAMHTALAREGEHRLTRLPIGQNPDGFTVSLRRLRARRVAYIRVLRPYEGDRVPRAAVRLQAWAEARALADGQWLGYQWEDPEVVPLEKCRYDVAVEVPSVVAADGEVSIAEFPGCLVAQVDVAGSIELELRALDWLYRTWLPNSGYAPDHLPGFEAWKGRPFAQGLQHFELSLQLPVVDVRSPL